MTVSFRSFVRVLVTLIVVAGAVVAGVELWRHYMDDPWTRDAKVRADVVGVAPDVSGFVSEVLVKDNQTVKAGDILFRIDNARYKIALEQAEATVDQKLATHEQAVRDRDRYDKLTNVVSQQQAEQARATEATAAAAYREAVASRDLAKLNLERTEIKAPVNGVVTNLNLQPGDYIAQGSAKVALVDTDSLRIEGYFEETKLSRINVGDPVRIRLMGQSHDLKGRVVSIAAGIVDRERSDEAGLLANVTPTFSWVRLAQRVPVRIVLDEVPADVKLVAGLTATVQVMNSDGSDKGVRSFLSWR
ncbi:efflux RND transporter periplasmic adaptor subunit [Ancylobacter sp. 6x-1]|uniref:Efflux RND transporter periplasmic adaptor subunit n=1 Tax=Ancylobacter crimeensis TaxID=2579147 RepID=A0ABT0DCU3_9HYPH|nr:efflux RND transporter periplasmic adaptor subunit [Ancylobacter crimeensis]MCK0197689.1 efflux RND transporter periplasmic adaptor subunit [Ancylobacter crimeensis]